MRYVELSKNVLRLFFYGKVDKHGIVFINARVCRVHLGLVLGFESAGITTGKYLDSSQQGSHRASTWTQVCRVYLGLVSQLESAGFN